MSITFIGSTLSIVSGAPSTEDQSGYEAQTHIEVGKVLSIGEVGDSSEDVTINLLKTGRIEHVNGVKDLGEIAVAINYDRADAGLAILEAANNTNTTHSAKITDTDGDDYYFQCVIANLKTVPRSPSASKGMTFVLRGQTGITKVDGA